MTKNEIWNENYNKLHLFYEENKTSYVSEDHELYEWCQQQRQNEKLSKIKKDKLDEIQFEWMVDKSGIDPKHREWINRIKSMLNKKGKIEFKNNDINNFLRLCIYRNEKGVLPLELKSAFDEAGIDLV